MSKDSERSFRVQSLDVESLQSVKTELGILDSVLKRNLDFAMKALEAMPMSKKEDAALQVEGEQTLIKINAFPTCWGFPVFHYVVWNDNNDLKLLQKIRVREAPLTTENICESHFVGHCCRDEFKSCMKQAREKLAHEKMASKKDGLANVELKIICGELHLTYVTSANSSTAIEIRPDRRVRIENDFLSDVLRVMHQMEKSGEMSPGMLACFQHLIASSPKAKHKGAVQILLMSDGKRVEFLHHDHLAVLDRFVIFIGANNKPEMRRTTEHCLQ
ncbi:uncharacterized protein LOC121719300 isoform X1 [Alosa sapidissima]|uniref:uncharacterized protein LOC121719300 isoform X1 n=2 Tax=Alosa sapidissima TaxID=34773 RepID=UPI001C08F22B|nr:uncharacterized protein LOC121719300 isoform X1 [Alosa sapidissima]